MIRCFRRKITAELVRLERFPGISKMTDLHVLFSDAVLAISRN